LEFNFIYYASTTTNKGVVLMKNFNLTRVLVELDNGNTGYVLDYCNKVLELDIRDMQAHIYKARAYFELGDYSKVLIVLGQAVDIGSANGFEQSLIYEEYIETYSKLSKFETALHYCNKALDFDKDDIDLLFTKAILLYRNARYQEALDTLRAVKILDTECLYREESEVLKEEIISWIL
jgi:tetratricopeptide (TPR) repeat protein